MTILCLVRDTRDGSWAAFADCLITSDEVSEGRSLITPNRPNYGSKETFGFAEVALEEKIGFVEDQLILGWANERREAVDVCADIRSRRSDDEIKDIIAERKNPYIVIKRNEDGEFRFFMYHPHNQLRSAVSGDYEFFFFGSGSRILEGRKFTSRYYEQLGEAAPNAAMAAFSAVGRFLSEEMTGSHSQFYSLRTGGHYRVFYGHPDGIRQLYFAVNHWHQGEKDEPLVHSISVPYICEGYECLVEYDVGECWNLEFKQAIALSPLLQSPRQSARISIKGLDVLNSALADGTIHVCWTDKAHTSFIVPFHEPRFSFVDGFEKFPHKEETVKAVQDAFTSIST